MNLENVSFSKMCLSDADEMLAIINYYVANSTFYFAEMPLEKSSITSMLAARSELPGYVVRNSEELIGFGYAYLFRPESTFAQTVKLTYWLKEGFTRRGIGYKLYNMLESRLRELKIVNVLVNISSDNEASLNFHAALGYVECGHFKQVGFKNGVYFDVIWLQKSLD